MRKSIKVGIVGLLAVGSMSLTGCGKMMEPYKDAPVQSRNTAPADVASMPDGFSNFASKCDHGNRVYVVFHGDGAYGSLDVVPNDPTCRGQ